MILNYPLNEALEKEAQNFIFDSLEVSFTIQKFEISVSNISIQIQDSLPEEELKKLIKNLIYISSSIGKNILFENNINLSLSEDPMPHLLNSNQVKDISRGIFMFQGVFLSIFSSLNQYLKDLAVNKFSAIEQEYPTIWPIDLFKKINYLKEFPHQTILTTTVKDNYKDRKSFANKYSNLNEYDKVKIDDNLDDCLYGLGPSVCNTCYYALSNEKTHKNTIYTTYNKVFRNESSKTNSLDRLMNFSVRDIMFVGDEQFVLATRQKLIDELVHLISFFEIDCKIESANDPFFSNDIARKLFQYSFGLKYELLASIPHLKSRIAIGSINLHLDTFGEAFNIKSSDGNKVSSGCIGIGFERIVYALFSQYGTNCELWPESLKDKLMRIGVKF